LPVGFSSHPCCFHGPAISLIFNNTANMELSITLFETIQY